MKIIIHQILQSFKKTPVLSVLIVLLYCAGLFIIGGTYVYLQNSEALSAQFTTVYGADSARVICMLSNRVTWEGIQKPECVEAIKMFYSELRRSYPQYGFFNFGKYWTGVIDYRGSDCYIDKYDVGSPSKNLICQKTGVSYSTLLNLMVSQDYLNYFKIRVTQGKDFSGYPKDYFTYVPGRVYPLIMGAGLAENYQIGDRVQLYMESGLPLILDFEVVGFLDKGQATLDVNTNAATAPDADETSEDKLLYLDGWLIVPWIDMGDVFDYNAVSEDANMAKMQKVSVLRPCYQMMICVGNGFPEEVTDAISDVAGKVVYHSETGATFADDVSGWGNVMSIPNAFYSEMGRFFNLLFYSSLFILLSCMVCISINLLNKVNANLPRYAIHLLCGAKLGDIRAFAIGEILAITLLSDIGALAALVFVGDRIFSFHYGSLYSMNIGGLSLASVLMILGVNAAVFVLSLAYPLWRINHAEYDTFLRGNE
ncbi:MAG TPA: hypothetical protein PK854_06100 [Oscillospiraceae bacterium]|nr:hypothetical protein [Oscillospiraceae bacterium]HPS34818.1 hypothetical protein [Oscillospiraceae bacterium]